MVIQKQVLSFETLTLEIVAKRQTAGRTIQRLRGRRLASLSPKDKDALIASLATLVVAAGSGRRPSPHVSGDIVSFLSGSGGDGQGI